MVVKNEDRFIWYSISSVLPYVERCLIYDTGSADNTVKIIKSFKSNKIRFAQIKVSDVTQIAEARNRQIEETETDWFWIVDGDEVYPAGLCREIMELVKKGDKLEGIVAGRYDLLGDIYHYQSESVGVYKMLGKKGHFALRLINKKNIAGLHVAGNYPYEEYFDENNIDLIFHSEWKFKFTEGKLFHAMYLPRSSRGASLNDTFHRKKYKLELGNKFSPHTTYPEVFFAERQEDVPDVTNRRSLFYSIGAYLVTPLKMIKRKLHIEQK